MLHFSDDEFAQRRARLCDAMKNAKLDALLIFAQESMFWLTGYDTFGYAFFQCLVFKANGDMILLTRSADLRQARRTSNISDIHIWTDSASANPAKELQNLMSDMGLLGTQIGVEYDTHGLTAYNGKLLDEALSSFANLHDNSNLISHLRTIKSADEIKYIKKAARGADDALDAALELTKAGVDEGEILAAMQGAIFVKGGDYPANEFIIGSGADALLCRYKSGRRKLSKNDQLTLEWAGTQAHYHVAMMRTLIIGKPKPQHVEYFEAALEALHAVEEAMQPGNTFSDVFNAHARAMDNAGLGRHRLNACGYNLGIRFSPSWMDGPMFFQGNTFQIQPDMSLFAHMIIMDSATETAMCLGQTYLTRDGKPKSLSRHNLELVVL